MGDVLAEERVRLKRLTVLLDDAALPDRRDDEARREIVRAVDGYLLPRLDRPDAPLLVAVAGLGGVGKSHLVNRLTGHRHCVEGVVRPTTLSPTVVVSSQAEPSAWGAVERRLRASAPALKIRHDDGPGTERMTFLDLPADDRDATTHRTLGLADLVLLVVTPERYADQATWSILRRLLRTGIPTWVVMNRTLGPGDEVVADFSTRLERAGLAVPVVGVADGAAGALGGLDTMLAGLQGADRVRLVDEGIEARTEAVYAAVAALLEPLRALHDAGADLVAALDAEYDHVSVAVREIVQGLVAQAPPSTWPVVVEQLASVVTRRVGVAAGRTAAAWSRIPGGAELLEADGHGLWRHSSGAATEARVRFLRWEADVASIVATSSRRSLPPRKADEVAAAVIRTALGDQAKVPWRTRRRLRGGIEPATEAAQERLADIACSIVLADKQRFIERLGPRPREESIAELAKIAGAGAGHA